MGSEDRYRVYGDDDSWLTEDEAWAWITEHRAGHAWIHEDTIYDREGYIVMRRERKMKITDKYRWWKKNK